MSFSFLIYQFSFILANKLKVKFFESNEKINQHVTQQDYGTSPLYPYICFAVALTKSVKGQYEYRIRYNASTINKEIHDTSEDRIIPLRK